MSIESAALAAILVALVSCTAQPFVGTCGMVPLGRTDGGIVVVKMACEPE